MIQLTNTGEAVTTVGELKELLAPFRDECELNALLVYYIADSKDAAKLEIRLKG